MAGSDLIALPDGALDDVQARVGASLRGRAQRHRAAVRDRLRPLQRRHHAAPARRRARARWPRRAPTAATSRWPGRPAPSSCRSSPGPSPTPARWTPCSASAPSSGATPATTTSWRGSARRGSSRCSWRPGSRWSSACSTTDTLEQALERSRTGRDQQGSRGGADRHRDGAPPAQRTALLTRRPTAARARRHSSSSSQRSTLPGHVRSVAWPDGQRRRSMGDRHG